MANNFDELYDQLSSTDRFNAYFTDKEDFQTFINENANSSALMKEMFDVDIEAIKNSEVKKKVQGEDFLSNSPLVGQTQTSNEQVVETEGMGGETPNPPVNKFLYTPPARPTFYKPFGSEIAAQRGSDVPTYGTSRFEIETKEKARRIQEQKDIAKRQGVITAAPEGTFKPQVKWPKVLEGLKDEFDGFMLDKEKIRNSTFNNQSEQENTEYTMDLYNKEIVKNPYVQNLISSIESQLKDNFKNEKEVEGEGIYMKRDRDGYLTVDPAYINSKVDQYFANNKVFGEDAAEYQNVLRQIVSVNLLGKYNGEVLEKVVTNRIGEFQPLSADEVETKFKQKIKEYDKDFLSSIETYKQSITEPIETYVSKKNEYFAQQKNLINSQFEQGLLTPEQATMQMEALGTEIAAADAERMTMVSDATTRFNKFINDKKVERSLQIEQLGETIEKDFDKLQQEKYNTYKKKYLETLKSYNEEQANANALYFRSGVGMGETNLGSFIWDSAQSSMANMVVSSMKLAGLEDKDLPWVNEIVNNLTKTVVGNQYMGRNMTDSKNILEAIGGITNQLIEQVPNIGASIAISTLTKNPYLTTAFMMYTDMAREVNDASSSIVQAGGNLAQTEIAKNNIVNLHLLMSPLYFGQGSLLTEGLTKPTNNFLSNYARATFAENLFEIPQEYLQTYTSLKETGSSDVKNSDGSFKSFGTWLSTADQGKLALEVLPTTMVMGVAPAVTSTRNYRKLEENYAAVGKILGDKQLTQYVSDMYNIMGRNVALVIPDHLRVSGQINDQEYQELKSKFGSYVQKLDQMQNAGVMDLDKSRLYLYKSNELEKLNQDMQQVTDPVLKTAMEQKAKNLEKLLQDVVVGKDVNLVKFKWANGASFVMTEEDAQVLLSSKGGSVIQESLTNETRNRKGEAVPMLSMETENSDLNEKLNELQKTFEEKKDFLGVFGLEQDKEFDSVIADNLTELEAMGIDLGVQDIGLRVQEAKVAQDFLNQRLPGVKIQFLSNENYRGLMKKIGGNENSNGNFSYAYDPKTKTYKASIQINLENANSKTIAHETSHAILLSMFGEDRLKYEDFQRNIKNFVEETRDQKLIDFVQNYDINSRADEYMAELIGEISNGEYAFKKDLLTKIAEYINKFVSEITGGRIVPFRDVKNSVEVLDFFESLTQSLSPKEITQEVATTETQEGVQPTEEGQKEVRSKAQMSDIEESNLRLNVSVKLEKELEKLRSAYVEGRKVEKDNEMGFLTEQEFAEGMFKVLDAQRKYRTEKQALKAVLPRERGSNFIIEKLSNAARTNSISQFEADLAIDLVRKNPAVFEDLAISITKMDQQNPDVAGYYRASDSLVKLFKRNTNELTATHELLHHTEKFLPLDVRNGIITEWAKQIDSEVKKITAQLNKETNPDKKQNLAQALVYLQLARQAQTDTDRISANAKQELMRKFLGDHVDTEGNFVSGLGREYYKFFNPSEWWAVNASELFAKANTKPELKTWLDKAKAFYAALMESVRKILGTSATAAIQKGLDTVLQGKTLDVSQETMLANINSSFDVQPQGVTQEGQTQEVTPTETLEQAGEMNEGTQPFIPEPIEIDIDLINRAQLGEPITIPQEELLGGKQIDPYEVFRQFKEENGRNPRIWFWMADQLKRGDYSNPKTGVNHFLEGGFNFANDQENIKNNEVWATGLDEKLLKTRLPNADYIWLMAGSPNTSFNFSKGTSKVLIKEIEAGLKNNLGKTIEGVRINNGSFEEFVKIAENMLPSDVKKWSGFLQAIKNPNMLETSARKVFAETMLHEGGDKKITLPFQQFLHQELGVPTLNEFLPMVREKFLVDNNWRNGDMGILLKPNGEVKYNSNSHDTYQNSILGETVGFPNRKINIKEILPEEALVVIKKETGLPIEKPSEPAIIKTAVGDLGKVYENINEVLTKSQAVRSEKSSGTTQVATTTGSYVKAANLIKDIKGNVLDYGAGLGLGTDAMSNTLGRTVDSFEPNPERWQGKREATFTASEQINKKYDAIVSLNVLNVVPKDIRDAIVQDIFDKLNVGGKAVISTRKWTGDVNAAKNAVPGTEEKSLIITRKQGGENVEVFQKGFDGNELVDYIQELLGDKATVVKNTSFGANGVIITKEVQADQAVRTKSQLDFTQIPVEFQNQLNNGVSELDIYKNLITQGYPYIEMENNLPAPFWNKNLYDQAVAEMAKKAIEDFSDLREQRQKEIADLMIGNYMLPIEEEYKILADAGYYPVEIYYAFQENRFATMEELERLFGLEYRNTVSRALDEIADPDFILGIQQDEQTRKMSGEVGSNDLTNVFIESGLNFADASVMVDFFTNFLEKNGLIEAAKSLRTGLNDIKNDPNSLRQHFNNFSELMSMSGRLLQMARFLFKQNLVEAIDQSLNKNNIVLTDKQKETLKRLTADYQAAQEQHKTALEKLNGDFSDAAYKTYFNSQKALGNAAVSLNTFLNDRKPTFWNDKITSGGSRALLGIPTVVLSFVANIENLFYSTNPAARGLQNVRDMLFGGNQIKGSTMSIKNWWLAYKLSTPKSFYDVSMAAKYGATDSVAAVEKYFDGLAQVNFFKDAKVSVKFVEHFIKKITGKEPWEMTDAEFVDAYNQTLIQMKSGEIQLRDGKTYSIARSLFTTLSIGPQLTEFTGRAMAFGGDIPFAAATTQRAIIDYLQNVKGTRFQNGIFESLLNNNEKLSKEAIRAMSSLILNDEDLRQPFVYEGLKRVLYGENPLSKGFGAFRSLAKAKIPKLYSKYRFEKNDPFTKGLVLTELRAYQAADVLLWTLMPFLKVPINFLGVAMAKTIPHISVSKYIFSEIMYNREMKSFEKKYKGKIPKGENKLKQYEKDKIELFLKKRQANYDFAQNLTSSMIYWFVTTAFKSGALLMGGEEEKEKELTVVNLKGNTYNRTLHMEYIADLLSGKDVSNFLAKRGKYAKEGDKLVGTNNLGFIGYGMNVWGSIFQKQRDKEQSGLLELISEPASVSSLIFNEMFNAGIESLPMFQGMARFAELFKEDKTGDKAEKFFAGTISTSLALFSPSVLSFVSKGRGETIQSVNDINVSYEDGPLGEISMRVIQKLNRNVSFLVKNEFYKAAIGPYGEDLMLKNTYGEPGSAASYIQAMWDPFVLRSYDFPTRKAQTESLSYVASLKTNAYLTNMLLIYENLTGRSYQVTFEGKGSNMWTLLSNPMPNEFSYQSRQIVSQNKNELTIGKVNFSLPNELYRAELKRRGELRLNAMQKYLGRLDLGTPGQIESDLDEISSLVKRGENLQAIKKIESSMMQFDADLKAVNEAYKTDFENRAKDIILSLIQKKSDVIEAKIPQFFSVGIVTKEQLKAFGYTDEQLISLGVPID